MTISTTTEPSTRTKTESSTTRSSAKTTTTKFSTIANFEYENILSSFQTLSFRPISKIAFDVFGQLSFTNYDGWMHVYDYNGNYLSIYLIGPAPGGFYGMDLNGDLIFTGFNGIYIFGIQKNSIILNINVNYNCNSKSKTIKFSIVFYFTLYISELGYSFSKLYIEPNNHNLFCLFFSKYL